MGQREGEGLRVEQPLQGPATQRAARFRAAPWDRSRCSWGSLPAGGGSLSQTVSERCPDESPCDHDIAAFKIPLDIGSPPFSCWNQGEGSHNSAVMGRGIRGVSSGTGWRRTASLVC